MRIKDLMSVITGNNKIRLEADTERAKALNMSEEDFTAEYCRAEFWHKFRNTNVWNAAIMNLHTEAIPVRNILVTRITVTLKEK